MVVSLMFFGIETHQPPLMMLFYVMAISLNHLNLVSEKGVNMFCIKFRTLCCCFHNLPNHSKTEPESESERIYAAQYTMRILQNQC